MPVPLFCEIAAAFVKSFAENALKPQWKVEGWEQESAAVTNLEMSAEGLRRNERDHRPAAAFKAKGRSEVLTVGWK